MIQRPQIIECLQTAVRHNPVTALLGPRQCGKTTIARLFGSARKSHYFDLENPVDKARLENPLRALERLEGLIVIDEIQRRPDLFELLRVLSDRRPERSKFLILGSASFELIRRSSESLAGRIGFVDMGGFTLRELKQKEAQKLWLRGGFPKSFLAGSYAQSSSWREDFIRTFLERDIPQLGIRVPAATLRRFWTMLAHYHGQTWNGSEIGASLGVAHTTARQHLDILTGAFVVRQVSPWFENVGKRVVKSPKVYVRDSGLFHSLLHIDQFETLEGHPKLGASWEGFVLEQILSRVGERDTYFWATHSGAELDLMAVRKGKRWGFEIKYADAPHLTKSMKIAKKDLQLRHLWVVYPGTRSYSLGDKIDCIGLNGLEAALDHLG